MSKKEKKILVPALRFPEFRNAGEWAEKELSKICEVNPSVNNLPETFVYIDLESVEAGRLLQKKIISRDNSPSRAQRLLKRGDVIFQMVRPYQKNNYIFLPNDDLDYVASTGYAQLRAYESNRYLFQYLHNDRFVDRVLAKCTGSNYPAINSSALSDILVEIPKPEEQQKIADCLTSIDELITAQTRRVNALKAHKKSLMQQLFPTEGETVPKLRFPEFRGKGVWIYDTFDNLVDVIDGDRGINYPKAEEFSASGFCLFLNAKNVTKDGFKFEELQFITKEKSEALRKGKLQRRDVVLTTRGSVGQFAYFTQDVPYENMRINSGMVILRVKSKKIVPDYLYAFSKSVFLAIHIENIAFGNAQQQLTVTGIKKLPICYPEPEEQQKIADCLTSVDDLITAQTQKLDALKAHKKGLMQQLFLDMDEVDV